MKFKKKSPILVYGTGNRRFFYWQYIPGDKFITDLAGYNKISKTGWKKGKNGEIVVFSNNSRHKLTILPSNWVQIDENTGNIHLSTAKNQWSFEPPFVPGVVDLYGETLKVLRKP